MKLIIWCMCIFFSSTPGWTKNNFNQHAIQLLSHEIKEDIHSAELCLPTITSDRVMFCTGINMPLKVVQEISSGGLNACVKMIGAKGYQVIQEGNHQKINNELWNSFYRSTKWAETLHKDKYVFIKTKGTEVDCLHEFIHVLQWTAKNNNSLSPIRRHVKYSKFEGLLLKASDQLSQLHKNDPIKTKESSSFIENEIKVLKKYSTISSWLDEKDVYVFLYSVCNKNIKCSDDDWDTIVGNLFQLKEKLPWRFRNEILQKASQLVRAKEESSIAQGSYTPLSDEDYAEINGLFGKSWEELISYIKNKNIRLYQFVMSDKKKEYTELDKIPSDVLARLEEPTKENLVSLYQYSKINQGFVLGKFICTEKPKEHFIILTSNSSKEVLIHEYMHYLQSLKNPGFCHALTEQNKSAIDFKVGKISRKDYESSILMDKVIIWRTEQEVYQFMSSKHGPSELENNNNKIQFLVYQARLTKGNPSPPSTEFEGTKINFSVVDNLPIVKIFENPFVLDLGAMDSVISPKLVFKNVPLEAVSLVKMKSLNNSLGESLEAPVVLLKHSFELDGQKVNQSHWILANLKLPGAEGVLGLSFFKGKDIVLYPKKKYIETTDFRKKPKHALSLQKDFDNEIRTIEFICPQKNLIVRLDSGSQVLGDLRMTLPLRIKNRLMSKNGYSCGKLQLAGKFETELQNEVLFSHDVGLNLGWPWLQQFNKVSISLKNAWIFFE